MFANGCKGRYDMRIVCKIKKKLYYFSNKIITITILNFITLFNEDRL
jgi:hypothetical protein